MIKPSPLSDEARLAYLRLARSEQVGPVSFRQLLEHYGSPQAALDALPELASRGGKRKFRICSRARAEQEWEALQRFGARLSVLGEPDYPPSLAALADAPPVLSWKGAAHLWHRPCVAMVGARSASAAAQKFTSDCAADVNAAGYVVVSGLARGVDACAHAASLAQGTIAVLAGGVDNIYPEENAALYEQLAVQGLLVSESRFGAQPQARHFPRRNRIISGLALGVVVVEAALRSGSLITARCAAEQGREVMAAPGSPLDPRCTGSNNLIRDGAHLVQSGDDVLAIVRALKPAPVREPFDLPRAERPPPPPPSDGERDAFRQLLSPTPMAIDELVRLSRLPLAKVLLLLLELELAGRLMRGAGQEVSLLAPEEKFPALHE